MVNRLPTSPTDDGIWAPIINNWLLAEHNADGTHTITATTGYAANAIAAGMPAATAHIDPRIVPPVTAQSLIDAASPGGTVTLGPYAYRERLSINKNLTLVGTAGTSIRGSVVVDDAQWIAPDVTIAPGYWRTSFSIPALTPDTNAAGGTRALVQMDQVFYDGLPMRRIESDKLPKPNEYTVDYAGYVVIGNYPFGHIIEVTTQSDVIVQTSANLTLTNLDVRHSASRFLGTQAAVQIVGSGGVLTMSGCTIMHHHGCGVGGTCSPGSNITGCEIAYNGLGANWNMDNATAGMVSSLATSTLGTLAAPNKIHHNGAVGADWNWTGGGFKLTTSDSWSIKYNEIYSNSGPGLWLDIYNTQAVIQFNRCHHNTGPGIMFEFSGTHMTGSGPWVRGFAGVPTDIAYNIVYENEHGDMTPGNMESAGGIFISSSVNVNVHDNLSAWDYYGINVIWEATSRGGLPVSASGGPNDILIYNNLIIGEGNYQNNWINVHAALLTFNSSNSTDRAALVGASNVGGYGNQFWQRVYGNTTSLDPNAAETLSFAWGATNYNTMAGLNASHAGRGPSGSAAVSAWISTTNNFPVPTAVADVLNGVSGLILDATFKSYVAAHKVPLRPELGHGQGTGVQDYWFNQQPNHEVMVTSAMSPFLIPDAATFIVVNASGGNVILTLPSSQSYSRMEIGELVIKRIDNGGNSVTCNSRAQRGNQEYVDKDQTSVTVAAKGAAGTYSGILRLQADGNNWWVTYRS